EADRTRGSPGSTWPMGQRRSGDASCAHLRRRAAAVRGLDAGRSLRCPDQTHRTEPFVRSFPMASRIVVAHHEDGRRKEHTMGQMRPSSRPIISTNPRATVQEVCELMVKESVGAVIVLDEGKLVGILSERDVVRRVVAAGRRNPELTAVSEVMTAPVRTAL